MKRFAIEQLKQWKDKKDNLLLSEEQDRLEKHGL